MVSLLPPTRLPLAQQERLLYIDMRLRFLGTVRRQDLIARFGIKTAAATRDLAVYRDEKPENWIYDSKTKSYFKTESFDPLYPFITADDAWKWLSPRIGETGLLDNEVRLPVDQGPVANVVSIAVMEAVTQAVAQCTTIEVTYASPWARPVTMTIVPHALADVAGHRYLRAFSRLTEEFETFELRWIHDARAVQKAVFGHEQAREDLQWSTRISLELVAHPDNVENPEALARSLGLIDGLWRANVRSPLVEILLETLGVDLTKGHKLRGHKYLWWLRNHADVVK